MTGEAMVSGFFLWSFPEGLDSLCSSRRATTSFAVRRFDPAPAPTREGFRPSDASLFRAPRSESLRLETRFCLSLDPTHATLGETARRDGAHLGIASVRVSS